MEQTQLKNVIGLEKEKNELLLIIDWFKNSEKLKAKGCTLPKGVLLYGRPGNGKTFIIKELIKNLEFPVFIVKGDEENAPKEITDCFNKAKKTDKSIVVIDELDLLLNENRLVVRAIQEAMDGVETNDNILVLCAANKIDEIPAPLLRDGRIDRKIEIRAPFASEALLQFKKVASDMNLILPDDLNEEDLGTMLSFVPFVSIKSIVNDIALRNGDQKITEQMINNSIYNITDETFDTSFQAPDVSAAYHEAGHAVIASLFPEFFSLTTIRISDAEGCMKMIEKKPKIWPYSKSIAHIDILMAGLISEKLLCKEGSRGCDEDLHLARKTAYNLFNCTGYSSCWETLPRVQPGSRTETQEKLRKMEEKIERLLKNEEEKTTELVKEHLSEIEIIGKTLLEKKRMKATEVLDLIAKI